MIPQFIGDFQHARDKLRAQFEREMPSDYMGIVKSVVGVIGGLDPDRIHEIDDGGYQGTLVYVIGEAGYTPSKYVWTIVDYGSCSGCDTLQAIICDAWSDADKKVDEIMTLALHIVEGMHWIKKWGME